MNPPGKDVEGLEHYIDPQSCYRHENGLVGWIHRCGVLHEWYSYLICISVPDSDRINIPAYRIFHPLTLRPLTRVMLRKSVLKSDKSQLPFGKGFLFAEAQGKRNDYKSPPAFVDFGIDIDCTTKEERKEERKQEPKKQASQIETQKTSSWKRKLFGWIDNI
ncbi:hypothetical protein [Rhodanobacter terrae]|uniref:Uncharacterized protein n=1 Tax=Rhodanobacter terrae TaxID=418647 RepID=A0ABW0T0V9_9GAMM